MNRLRSAVLGSIVVAMLLVGVVADRTLVHQAAIADRAMRADIEEKTRLLAPSVRDTLAKLETMVLDGRPVDGVTTCWSVGGARVDTSPRGRPYSHRDRTELTTLLSARTITANGLPEAVVAAIALNESASKSHVAERLLAGALPVDPNDLPTLVAALGGSADARLDRLTACLRRTPDGSPAPTAAVFARRVNAAGAVEAWSTTETGLLFYEIEAAHLVSLAGVAGVSVASAGDGAVEGAVSVPDIAGLTLRVAVKRSVQLRIQWLRVALWMAIATSIFGIATILRAVQRETRAMKKEKAFLANVTHELRTPLSAIRVFGETLADGRGEPREYGALVARECQRLDALVDHVLTTARVEEAPKFDRARPDEIVASALQLIASRAAARAIRIDWDRARGWNGDVQWDAPAVRRALLNLLDNAVKHGRSGGRVDLLVTRDGDMVKLSVADDGPGIRRRDRSRLFGRFERGDTDIPGTGLGLYAVEQIARAHGGRVDLVSQDHRGCTFTLVLPIHPRGATVPDAPLKGVAIDVGH